MLLYRLLLTALSPLFALIFLRQILRGRESFGDLAERFGKGAPPPTGTARLWVHGASNGELTAGRALIEEALTRAPDLDILITVNTVTARQMVRDWALPRTTVRLAPLDLRSVLNHFLDVTKPNTLLTIENEIWPNRFALLHKRNIALFVVGARMSERTASRWLKMMPVLGPATRRTMAAITRLAAQDTASEQRLLQLGLPPQALLPRINLKSTVEMDSPLPPDANRLRLAFPRDQTLLAASTHDGEEPQVIAAFQRLLESHPEARLILAPRHPSRSDAISDLLHEAGLGFARRSKGDAPDAPVYLADTLGEMALWYQLAGTCFVGGSLVERGGHTPFEPAQFSTAILHGPHIANHLAAYRMLDQHGGAQQVQDADTLAETTREMFDAPDRAHTLAVAGTAALARLRETATRQEAFWTALAAQPGLSALN